MKKSLFLFKFKILYMKFFYINHKKKNCYFFELIKKSYQAILLFRQKNLVITIRENLFKQSFLHFKIEKTKIKKLNLFKFYFKKKNLPFIIYNNYFINVFLLNILKFFLLRISKQIILLQLIK
jgi:hypothetical protein